MTILYFDIESIPASEDKLPLLQRLHEEKVAKEETFGLTSTPRDFDTFYRRTALNGAHGQIFCISLIKEVDGEITLQTTLRGAEPAMIKSFWEYARGVHLYVGHGIRFFDIKFLIQRSIIHNITCLPINLAKFRDNPIYDTMEQWMCYDGTISLHELALALGIPSPKDQGIDGSQVYDFYLAGKLDAICDYCMRDVETERLVYKRLVRYKA
jgi:DNA polymerase elongation subunit (family B)